MRPTRPPVLSADRELRQWREDVYELLSHYAEKTVDLGSIAAGAVATFTLTVPGARANNGQVIVGVPSALAAGLMAMAFVSADHTVTVRVQNTTGAAIDPVSQLWSVRWIPK